MQTNNYDKYDQIYYGMVAGTTEEFEPSITLTPLGSTSSLPFNIVAQAAKLEQLGVGADVCGNPASTSTGTSTGSLASMSVAPASASGTGETNTTPSSAPSTQRESSLSVGAKAGIGVAAAVAFLALLLAALLLFRRHRLKSKAGSTEKEDWSGKPELAADGVQRHERLAEKDGVNVNELDVPPSELPAGVLVAELDSGRHQDDSRAEELPP